MRIRISFLSDGIMFNSRLISEIVEFSACKLLFLACVVNIKDQNLPSKSDTSNCNLLMMEANCHFSFSEVFLSSTMDSNFSLTSLRKDAKFLSKFLLTVSNSCLETDSEISLSNLL